MAENGRKGYVFNLTKQAFLCTKLEVADTHWRRLVGLIAVPREKFFGGGGLWIVPCHGIHTCAMRYAIDVVYLDSDRKVVHIEENVRPWNFTPMRMESASVLELPPYTIFNSATAIGDELEIVLQGETDAATVRA